MIQRIQSLYLLITAVLSGLFLTGNILYTSGMAGNEISMTFNGIYNASGSITHGIIPFTAISLLIPLLSLITILFFRKRTIQIKMTLVLLCLEVLLIIAGAIYCFAFLKYPGGNIIPGYRSIIPLVTIVLTFLALRGIKKDEDLVKSYDRLR